MKKARITKKKQILVEYPEWNDMNKTFRKNCDEKVYHAKSILEEQVINKNKIIKISQFFMYIDINFIKKNFFCNLRFDSIGDGVVEISSNKDEPKI